MNKVRIIAEAGVNHNGDIEKAYQLIDAAKEAGADYVKFQTFKAENLVTKDATKAEYQIENTKNNDSQFQMLKKLEINEEDHLNLINYCERQGIRFLSTAFDLDSINFLKDKIDFFKIPSGEITNYPYLVKVAKLRLPIVMSTGMADINEVKEAFNVLVENGVKPKEMIILHCNTEYPTPMEDVNLKAMFHIQRELGVAVGYSDHTLGIEVPIAAVALGASVIEKHFTLDRNLPGPDHKASLEPHELKAMVSAIRNIELAMSGDAEKKPSESEKKNIKIARKGIYLKESLQKGDILKEEHLSVMRPEKDISAMEWNNIIGKTIVKDCEAGDSLKKEHIN